MAENTSQNMVKENAAKIVEQLEYYFGDFNLPRDKFLRNLTSMNDGWVPMDIIMKFNRIASLTNNQPLALLCALNLVKSEIVELSTDGTRIRRTNQSLPEFTAENIQETKSRSIHFHGFPKKTTLDDLKTFFGKVTAIKMRYYKNSEPKKFCGAVVVTFQTLEDAKKCMDIKDEQYKDNIIHKTWLLEHERNLKNRSRIAMICDLQENITHQVIENFYQRNAQSSPLLATNFIKISNISHTVSARDVISVFQEDFDVNIIFLIKVSNEPKNYVYCNKNGQTILQNVNIEEKIFWKHRTIEAVSETEGNALVKLCQPLITCWSTSSLKRTNTSDTNEANPGGDTSSNPKNIKVEVNNSASEAVTAQFTNNTEETPQIPLLN